MSASDPPRAVVFGCAGPALSDAERRFFAEADPLGFILFGRNVETPAQVAALVAALRDVVGRADAPVLIDQEGGRVRRLKPPHWRAFPPAATIGALASSDADAAARAAFLAGRLIAADLAPLGVSVDCAPVCDVAEEGTHDAIGDRAFARDPALVARLARAFAVGLADGAVAPVMKHMPGQGRACVDSHAELPVVHADWPALERVDFRPFAENADIPWGMTAHVVYSAIDPQRPATCSPDVIARAIRGAIGFAGPLLTDDLSMNALKGGVGERAAAALAAGCDVALHCNGRMDEMQAVAAAVPRLADAALSRIAQARRRPLTNRDRALDSARQPRSIRAMEAQFAGLIGAEIARSGQA